MASRSAISGKAPRRSLLLALATPAFLLAAGCGGGGGPGGGPLVGATVVAYRASPSSPGGGAIQVEVLDATTGQVVADATVTANGAPVTWDPGAVAYTAQLGVTPGLAVTVRVVASGRTATTTGTLPNDFPVVTSPAPGDRWRTAVANELRWSSAPAEGDVAQRVGVLAPEAQGGYLLWPATGEALEAPRGTTSATVQALSFLSSGDASVLLAFIRELPFSGAAPGSFLALATADLVPFQIADDTARQWRSLGSAGLPEFASLRDLAFTGSGYVVVGSAPDLRPPPDTCLQYALVATSPDASTWSPRTACGTTSMMVFQSVAASPGMVVVVGGPVISTSPDGATFTEQPPRPATSLSRVRWTGEAFVAVGAAGAVLTSPDGLDWSSRDSGTTADLLDVAGSPARAVIAGTDGLRWSDDLAAWHAASSPPPTLLTRLVWTGDRFVGAGGATIATSPDGDAWTVETTQASATILGFASSGPTVVGFADAGKLLASTTPGAWVERQAPWGYPTYAGVWDGLRFVGVMDVAQVIASP